MNWARTHKEMRAQNSVRNTFERGDLFLPVAEKPLEPTAESRSIFFFVSLFCTKNKTREGATSVRPKTALLPAFTQPVSCV